MSADRRPTGPRSSTCWCATRTDSTAATSTWSLTVSSRTRRPSTPARFWLQGPDAIIRYARERLLAFRSTMHVIANVTVDFGGHDLATTDCYCTAYLVQAAVSGERVLIRGLRYVDQFVRRDGRWRITDRRHLPQWMAELPTVPLA